MRRPRRDSPVVTATLYNISARASQGSEIYFPKPTRIRNVCSMFGRFLPKNVSFFDFFEQHALKTVEGAKEFLELAHGGSDVHVIAKAKRIKEIEHETDVITHHCVEALHKTFVTPIERDDIYRLITKMDDIMDYVEAAADRIALYELYDPTPEVRELGDVLLRATEEVERALRGLRHLEYSDGIIRHCIDINRLENEADTILRAAVAKLFKEEKDPIQIIKVKEIYENLEDATDSCEDVANIIEGVVLENA
jgi:predicted phosphate transport protein (TIGR00153 family)